MGEAGGGFLGHEPGLGSGENLAPAARISPPKSSTKALLQINGVNSLRAIWTDASEPEFSFDLGPRRKLAVSEVRWDSRLVVGFLKNSAKLASQGTRH